MAFWTGRWFTVLECQNVVPILELTNDFLSSFHIYCFVLVSGYLYAHGKYEKGKYDSILIFLRNKVLRLLVPLVFVSFFWILPIQNIFYNYSGEDIINNFILFEAPGQCWFLMMLFVVFVIQWGADKLFKHKEEYKELILALALFTTGVYLSRRIDNYFQIAAGFQYYIFFYMGTILRKLRASGKYKIIDNKGIHIIIYVVFICSLFVHEFVTSTRIVLLATNVTGAISAFWILQFVAERISWKDVRGIRFVVKNSMGIYLFHQQIIFLILNRIVGSYYINAYVGVAVNFILAFGISLIISEALMKYKYTRLLIGETKN